MDTHTTTTVVETREESPQVNPVREDPRPLTPAVRVSWREGQFFQSLEALRPWASAAVILCIALWTLYMSQRDSSAQQAADLREVQDNQIAIQKTMDERWMNHNKDLLELKGATVSRELFEERTKQLKDTLVIIDNRTMEILDRLPVRNP